ncbi:hypothetical protein PTSG_06377 [Salpingoeca rosetta]|uniref:Uncharacterized protein n=1 Tax=Salpingoeca rosetta (strain ATCC 50818 / BSB-021) TaxID=946362 RepID=F2UCQ9_SALR5|nr:uncharacterized protein PTSG_06377 [Salpingoeca rosetta]EGD74366.1 hypothetical protein PTSG_06377 [Salpingoeca rosetta]|eukprot:XP_004993266.1 hypothetical protein PTSG_06377 [Salpingoeca rosetta]
MHRFIPLFVACLRAHTHTHTHAHTRCTANHAASQQLARFLLLLTCCEKLTTCLLQPNRAHTIPSPFPRPHHTVHTISIPLLVGCYQHTSLNRALIHRSTDPFGWSVCCGGLVGVRHCSLCVLHNQPPLSLPHLLSAHLASWRATSPACRPFLSSLSISPLLCVPLCASVCFWLCAVARAPRNCLLDHHHHHHHHHHHRQYRHHLLVILTFAAHFPSSPLTSHNRHRLLGFLPLHNQPGCRGTMFAPPQQARPNRSVRSNTTRAHTAVSTASNVTANSITMPFEVAVSDVHSFPGIGWDTRPRYSSRTLVGHWDEERNNSSIIGGLPDRTGETWASTTQLSYSQPLSSASLRSTASASRAENRTMSLTNRHKLESVHSTITLNRSAPPSVFRPNASAPATLGRASKIPSLTGSRVYNRFTGRWEPEPIDVAPAPVKTTRLRDSLRKKWAAETAAERASAYTSTTREAYKLPPIQPSTSSFKRTATFTSTTIPNVLTRDHRVHK